MPAESDNFGEELSGQISTETDFSQAMRTRVDHQSVTRVRDRARYFAGPNEVGERTTASTERLPDPVIKLPKITRTLPREAKLQEWEGQVQTVTGESFTANLTDVTAGSTEEGSEVELLMDDLSDGDRGLVFPGAVFRWILGYRYSDGQKDSFSRIVMRRLPIWTTPEIKEADREAAELHDALFADGGRRHSSARSD